MLTHLVRGTIAAALVASGATVALSASPAFATCSVSAQAGTPAYMGSLIRTSVQGYSSCVGPEGHWGMHHDLYRNGRLYRTWSYSPTRASTVYSTKDVGCVNGLFHAVVRLGNGSATTLVTSNPININC